MAQIGLGLIGLIAFIPGAIVIALGVAAGDMLVTVPLVGVGAVLLAVAASIVVGAERDLPHRALPVRGRRPGAAGVRDHGHGARVRPAQGHRRRLRRRVHLHRRIRQPVSELSAGSARRAAPRRQPRARPGCRTSRCRPRPRRRSAATLADRSGGAKCTWTCTPWCTHMRYGISLVEEPVVAADDVDERRRRARRVHASSSVGEPVVMLVRREHHAVRDTPTRTGTYVSQPPSSRTTRVPAATSSRDRGAHRAAVLGRDRRLRAAGPAGRTGTRRSGRAGGGSSRRRARRGSRTRARTRSRAGRAAPRCARPRGRRRGARRRRRSSRASRRDRGSRGRPRPRPAPGATAKPDACGERAVDVDRVAGRERRPAVLERAHRVRLRAPRARRRRTGTRPCPASSGARFGRAWRSATIATHSRVSGSSAQLARSRELREHLGGEAVEAVDVERRAHREDEPLRAGVAVLRRPGRPSR